MIAEVIVDISNDNVDKVYDYIVPDDIVIGSRVKISFGRQKQIGYVVNLKDKSDIDKDKLKPIEQVLNSDIVLSDEMLELNKFMTNHFFLRPVDVFKLMLPTSIRKNQTKQLQQKLVSINEKLIKTEIFEQISKRAKTQIAVASFLLNNGEYDLTQLNKLFDANAVKTLIEKNILQIKIKNITRKLDKWAYTDKKLKLTDEQKSAIAKINATDDIFLLKGVTGSGKTEVYLQTIENCIKKGKTAIMLVPEISLTPQMLSRFVARFGSVVAMLHSGLSDGEKYDEWMKIYQGKVKVVLGARSAVFAPLENLGIIIIDEEHDQSYISNGNPRYVTEEVAKFRAEYNRCPLVLGSATPKIESYKKAVENEYVLIKLTKRINNIGMPPIEICDMMSEVLDGNVSAFSRSLLSSLKQTIKDKKQAMIFINRRGYASFVICRECGYVAKCADCDVPLVYHKADDKLKCHFCARRYKSLTNCPNCNSMHIRYGAVGTQRVVNELKEIFPDVPILRMDNDTTRGKDGHKKILEKFSKLSPAILVGTQMIAKGHDFEGVSFVGIIDADVSLYNSDFKSTENTFQLVTQVAGRAGRANNDGYVVLQTYSPKHYVYKFAANYDYEGFYQKEINLRQTTQFPPFAEIVRILISAQDKDLSYQVTKEIFESCKQIKTAYADKILFMQAMPSPVKRIQNKFRFQVLIRYLPDEKIRYEIFKASDIIKRKYTTGQNGAMTQKNSTAANKKNVSVFIEINPQNMR